MSLEKRIKRHIVGRRHEFFAVTLPGFESLCAKELGALSETLDTRGVLNGGVPFTGRLSDLYLAALHARIPIRLLMRVAAFKASNFGQLEMQTGNIAWELYLPEGVLPECHVTTRHSRLYHTGAIADHIADVIAARWSELNAVTPPPSIRSQALYVRLENDTVTLSLDGCGDPLYQRGLKPHSARAPLRETTAAGILTLAGFRPDAPLVDPMCGSGTFSLEAAMMAKRIPPGFYRSFAFMQWPAFRTPQWAHMRKAAGERIRRLEKASIQATDADEKAVTQLRDCILKNRMDDAIVAAKKDFFHLPNRSGDSEKGLIVLNPPYGRRLPVEGDMDRQYGEIAAKLKSDFKGWRAALLVPHKRLVHAMGLTFEHLPIQHGGLNITLLTGRI